MDNIAAFINHLLNEIPETLSLQYFYDGKFEDVIEFDSQHAYEIAHTGGLYSSPKPAIQLGNNYWLLIETLDGEKLRVRQINAEPKS